MPQETNLNVSPYFDDFNEDKNFKRVLFKPGSPVQARELTQLQTLLQNQMEKFGQHFFKEGSMVIPGNIGYDPNYHCIELEDTFLGIPISEYLDQLVGKTIRGETSGVEATVVNYIVSTKSDRGRNTLYFKYTKAGNDFATTAFTDGENLTVPNSDIEYGTARIIATNPFATALPVNASSIGSACTVQDGVYFIRGYFVNVTKQTVIIDQYSNEPSARIGLFLDENIVTAFDDDTLFDNAAGYSNYAAPGADRFQLKTTLISKDLDDLADANFIELLRVEKGDLQKMVRKTDYNILAEEFARRTYDESGNYYVKPFAVQTRESHNNGEGNNGVYLNTEKTQQGNEPSSDLMCYQLAPGKAYVRGFEVERIGTTFLDVEKPRTTKELKKQSIVFDQTASVKVDRVYGVPNIQLGVAGTLSLRDQRIGSGHSTVAGNEIGIARVYDFKLENVEYSNVATKYELFLWDIQTYTSLVLHANLTAIDGSLIEGVTSGARGYLKSAVTNGTALTLTSTNGTFLKDEPIKVNGVKSNQMITVVTEYSFDDVKSIYQSYTFSGTAYKFNADTDLSKLSSAAPAGTEYTINHSNGVVSVGGNRFKTGVKVGDYVRYQKASQSDPTYNKVTAVANTGATITITGGVTDVTGVCKGALTGSTITVTDFKVVRPQLINARNASLISDMPVGSISNVDLQDSEIQIRRIFEFTVAAGNKASISVSENNQFFEPYDEERYNIVYADGVVESLQESNLVFNTAHTTVSINNLSKSAGVEGILVATLKKTVVKTQSKVLTRCNKVIINRSQKSGSGSAANTLNDGLTTSAIYGTRVQDKEISLNIPDGLRVHAVFEASTKADPSLPQVTLVNRSSALTNTVQGELLTGSTSGATARVVSSTTTTVDIVYTNDLEFIIDEIAIFKSSGITGSVSVVSEGDKNIVDSFIFDNGQRDEFYDYARIIKKDDAPEPIKRLCVIFDNYTLDGEVGDFGTVNSYDSDNFEFDIPSYRGVVSDYIDARPRIVEYDPSSATTSPFAWDTRSFNVSGAKPSILVGDESVTIGYSHYLARIDKVYLHKDGNFELKKGAPAPLGDVVAPVDPAGSFVVATINNDPYLRNSNAGSKVSLAIHKRYTMADIGRLESRLQNVEYYTQLSLLETDTASLSIVDAKTGLDRFKSGFFVDNFRSHEGQALGHPNFRTSIDRGAGELRPTHYTHGIDLLLGSDQIIGIGTTANPNADLTQVSDLQSNSLKRTGDVVTLDYTKSTYIEQKFATRTENVNPFAAITWNGAVELNPNSDVWVDEKRLKSNVVEVEGNHAATLHNLDIDPNTGLSPIDWAEWEVIWSSTNVDVQHTGTNRSGWRNQGSRRGNGGDWTDWERTRTDSFEETITIDRNLTRSGIQFKVDSRLDMNSLGDKLVSNESIPYMRSRNIEFIGTRLQPGTQFYTFFDSQSISKYVTPKLIEIEMVSGVFQVGEQVIGTSGDSQKRSSVPYISFRTAQPDHKFGDYNSPRITYGSNPYSSTTGISSSYSATSSIMNVDTGSLQLKVLGTYYGHINKEMSLVGQTSGAEAKVKDVRLISDEKGAVLGSLFIPDPNNISAPEFTTGTKTFRISSSSTDSRSTLDKPSTAQANFRAEGTLNTVQEDVMAVRNAVVETLSVNDEKSTTETNRRTFQTQSFENRSTFERDNTDPIAQSFEVQETNGVFLESVDVWFQTKDATVPVTLQIRSVRQGYPTQQILAFASVTLDPDEVNVSEYGTVATNFKFPSPVFLEGNSADYAIVLISMSDNYNAFICRMGEEDLADINLESSERKIVSQQPHLGSFFKSQNGATWSASQFEDLKFTLNKCDFVAGPGILKLYNPELGVGEIENPILRPNPLSFKSNEVQIKFSGNSSTATSGWPVGSRLTQASNTTTEGNVVAHLGPLATATYIANTGIGITPAASNLSYAGIGLTAITGDGSGAVATIVVNSGTINSISITGNGSGYKTGDVVGANVGETGTGIRFKVGSVSNTNSVILDRVQGTFNTSGALTIVGGAALNNGVPASVDTVATDKDGLHVKVFHRNHGMHATNNRVTISNAVGVSTVTTLSEAYGNTSTSAVKVPSVAVLSSFEGLTVSATNPGYVKIGNEVIKYTGVNAGTTPQQLTGITRGIDNTIAQTHAVGKRVRKYEAAGISLRRINTTHLLSNSSVAPGLDHYTIKIDVTSNGNGATRDGTSGSVPLRIAETEIRGGEVVRATQNIPFEAITPMIEMLTPADTTLSGRVRTTSGTSADGSETSFQDQGFDDVALNGINYFDTPRIMASKINEQNNLDALPGNKSFTSELVLSTKDIHVSPVIDLDRLAVIATSNRIDKPITDYRGDVRVNSIFGDPNSAIYITKRIALENPATSLQVRFAAFNAVSTDIRVLYRLIRADIPSNEQPFELFPGYKNLKDTTGDGYGDEVINSSNNDGTPDRRVPDSRSYEEFRDNQFTANDLPEFHGFQIKIIMTSTNQAVVPRIKDLRAIALA